jgi:hypothetical protein
MSTMVRLYQPYTIGSVTFTAGQVVFIGDDTVAQGIINAGHGVATVQWTFNQFMNRFTPTEQLAIATGARTNAQTFLWFTMGAGANNVDPTDPAVKAGLDGMVTAGFITQDRENAILNPTGTSP